MNKYQEGSTAPDDDDIRSSDDSEDDNNNSDGEEDENEDKVDKRDDDCQTDGDVVGVATASVQHAVALLRQAADALASMIA